ncbi:MAG: glutamine synthetase III [Bacteroidia bacterium]|nr:glutamine synthetase III [Bacteroidia bacterium]MDW8236642.1 glutamine synthetase III [Bacteroidia bacterium]
MHSIATKPINGTSSRLRVELFGELVFSREPMRRYLSESALEGIERWEKRGERISRELADEIANALRQWAQERGATHFTHWFHPLTGLTAEKHEHLYDVIHGKVLSALNGDELIQQEPDASSFPSGGLRSTFEARGYTAWDPSSPPFIYGKTLCVPSVYVSYDGHALDYKTPLLRSIEALNRALLDVVKLFYRDVHRVYPTLGVEQEFFLIPQSLFKKRPDLMLTGRTLIGAPSPRGQQMEDHYFGSIPEAVLAFYEELELEAWRLGIPLKTRHNEVAPAQYECAPVFEELNVAIDHNQLLMDLLKRTARRHGMECLLHEKPFAGINGSGKHNNWSLSTDTGINLLSPGKNPKENLRFFTFLAIVLRAVYKHADLLRATIATPGNEHRLGGNEAPPAILSVFLGGEVTAAVEALEKVPELPSLAERQPFSLLPTLPPVLRDNTDRNRTAPFAFTGNKFEFRAVGASAHCAPAMISLNAAVAEAGQDFLHLYQSYTAQGSPKNAAILLAIRDFLRESRPIRFDGNNYDAAWHEEAARRGLSTTFHLPHMLKTYHSPATKSLFRKLDILSETELHARYEVRIERYVKALGIELHTLLDMLRSYLIPAAIRYQQELVNLVGSPALQTLAQAYAPEVLPQQKLLESLQHHLSALWEGITTAEAIWQKVRQIGSVEEQAEIVHDEVGPIMRTLRYHADEIEKILPAALYPFPRYAELLFEIA